MRPALVVIAGLFWSAAALAQTVDLGGGSGGPVEIEAVESLDWHSEQKLYVARGDARLRQGDTVLYADVLTEHYRDLPDGGTQIWRAPAAGLVVLRTPTTRTHGAHGDCEQTKSE